MRAKSIILTVLILAGCGSTPKPADPPRLKAALEAESDGAKRYERGDYIVATRRFEEAVRIYASIDDATGTSRNRLHLARTELARGQAEAALLALAGNAGDPTVDTLMLTAQAQLVLDRLDAAQRSLAAAAGQCATPCPQLASLNLLRARAALAGGQAPEALAHAEAALKLLRDGNEANETANAWRLIASARLAAGDAAGALPAAGAALDIDRRLALPEKIARDWLLIGDIRRKVGDGATAVAYRRALDVANAAGLAEIARAAALSLGATAPGQTAPR